MAKTKQKEVTVSKETDEVWDCIVDILVSAKQQLADGFQPSKDLPPIALAAYKRLPQALEGFGDIKMEAKEKLPAFIMANSVGAARVAGVMLKKS